MIPDFKTYLRESIWSDMQDRGTRDVIKKEDDIDLMDIDDFMVYLKNRYICNIPRKRWKVENWFLGGEDKLMQVDMPIEDISEPGIKMTYTLRLTYDYGKMECIDIASSFQTFFEEYPEFKKYASDNYQLIKKSKDDFRLFVSDNLIVSKPGKELKFHDYVELVDKALSCVKKPYLKRVMNESIWSDMQERGTGDMIKKEDEIDFLDQDSFYEYIKEHYKSLYYPFSIDNNHKPKFDNEIHVPFINVDNDYSYNLVMKYMDNGMFVVINKDIEDEFPDVYKLLSDNYKIDNYNYNKVFLCLSPLDGSGKITNTFYLNVLDFLIDNLPDNNLKIAARK